MTKEKNFLDIDLSNNNMNGYKANYLSRVFGIFYEDLIKHCWGTEGYILLGRPSVYDKNKRYKTYDYMVEKDRKRFIVEAKCYVAYEDFKHIELTLELLKKWDKTSGKKFPDKDAFQFFLELGTKREPYEEYTFFYTDKDGKKSAFEPTGKILIWARVKKGEDEKKKIKEEYNFSDLFSVEDMMNKNKNKKNDAYYQYILNRKKWTDELFKKLLGE